MPSATRGEVWLVDLDMVAKARPAVVVSISFHDNERGGLRDRAAYHRTAGRADSRLK
jgi:hypothetical protein